jgi:hypothetical protein
MTVMVMVTYQEVPDEPDDLGRRMSTEFSIPQLAYLLNTTSVRQSEIFVLHKFIQVKGDRFG